MVGVTIFIQGLKCAMLNKQKSQRFTLRFRGVFLILSMIVFEKMVLGQDEQLMGIDQTMKINFEKLAPPKADKKPASVSFHGITLDDPYHWLRDENWKTPEDGAKNPEILKYLEDENRYCDAFMDPLKPLVDDLFNQWKSRLPDVEDSVKLKDGPYLYFRRQYNKDQYPIYIRQKDESEAKEEVYFDTNKEAEASGSSFYRVSFRERSKNHQYLAYNVDTQGNEFHTLFIRNLETGETLSDQLKDVSSLCWDTNSQGFFYLKHTNDWRTLFLYYHTLGTKQKDDVLLFEEKDLTRILGLGETLDEHYLILQSSTNDDDEIYVLDMKNKDLSRESNALRLILPRQKDRHAQISHWKGYFYLLINDKGPNNRVVRVPVENPSQAFEEVIPHNEKDYISEFEVMSSHFVATYKKDGLNVVYIIDPNTKEMRELPVDDACYHLATFSNKFEDPFFYCVVSSLARPSTTYKVSLKDLSKEVVRVQTVQGGYDQSLYQVDRHWITARDGVKVPVSVAYRKDKFRQGEENPCLLYGYGSYGIVIEPEFSQQAVSFMDQGFVYAIAHPRGGEDLGYQWYLDGKYLKKKNTFHDFIDVAKGLCEKGYTKEGSISAMGGSAGGMLMGYIANNAPELFRAIAAIVPFVDVINTMTDISLPLTAGEFLEWGNPIESKEYFDYMLSYSPYENVKKQDYPAMFISGGLKDSRVTYWEPAKWTAKLRELNTSHNPLIMKMIMKAGHAGGSARDEDIRERLERLAFFMKVNGLVKN